MLATLFFCCCRIVVSIVSLSSLLFFFFFRFLLILSYVWAVAAMCACSFLTKIRKIFSISLKCLWIFRACTNADNMRYCAVKMIVLFVNRQHARSRIQSTSLIRMHIYARARSDTETLRFIINKHTAAQQHTHHASTESIRLAAALERDGYTQTHTHIHYIHLNWLNRMANNKCSRYTNELKNCKLKKKVYVKRNEFNQRFFLWFTQTHTHITKQIWLFIVDV